MKRTKLILPINKYNWIQIVPSCDDDCPGCENKTFWLTCRVDVALCLPTYSILLAQTWLSGVIDGARTILEPLLHEGRALHPSFYKNNIGYLWNDYMQGKKNKKLVYKTGMEGYSYWVGEDYGLWGFSVLNAVWLYNKEGHDYLEVTPFYQWYTRPRKPYGLYQTYSEFKKNYQPIIVLEIPREMLLEWEYRLKTLWDEMVAAYRGTTPAPDYA